MTVAQFCGPCADSLGVIPLSGAPSEPCQALRTFGRIRCDTVGADVVPGVYWRPNMFETGNVEFSSLIPGYSIPAPGESRDISITLTAPAGCGSPDDDRVYYVASTLEVAGFATSGQFNATHDFAISGQSVFPNIPIPWLSARPFGSHTDLFNIGFYQLPVPAGQSRTFTRRLTRNAGSFDWGNLVMRLHVWGDYSG